MSEKFDLGILLVHGVGSATQGETLASWGQALIDSLKKRHRVKVDPGGVDLQAENGRANLSFTVDDRHSVLVAEAWWAEAFPPPSYGLLMRWGHTAGIWTVVDHMDERFRRAGNDLQHAWEEKSLGRVLAYLVNVILEGLWLFLGLLLAPLTILLLVLTGLLAVVPVEAIRSPAIATQRALTATLGDSFVFSERPVIKDAIVKKVLENLDWLKARVDDDDEPGRLAVVAHSQGAAVSHEALNQWGHQVDLLTTFGSGLRKLKELERLRSDGEGAASTLRDAKRWAAATVSVLTVAALLVWSQFLNEKALVPIVVPAFLIALASLGVRMLFRGLKGGDRPSDPQSEDWRKHAKTDSVFNWLFLVVMTVVAVGGWRLEYWSLATCVFTVLLGLTFTLQMQWRHCAGRATHRDQQKGVEEHNWEEFECPRVDRWDDYYAVMDPVSNGALLDVFEGDESLSMRRVVNHDSLFRDHNGYWKNELEFVDPLADRLLKLLDGGQLERKTRLQDYTQPVPEVYWNLVGTLLIAIAVVLLILIDGPGPDPVQAAAACMAELVADVFPGPWTKTDWWFRSWLWVMIVATLAVPFWIYPRFRVYCWRWGLRRAERS